MKKQYFREKLIETRKARGLTQEEVAKKCKITVRTIQRIESGQVTPRVYTIKAISENLGIVFFETSNYDVKFNLKINSMKKISILTILFLLV